MSEASSAKASWQKKHLQEILLFTLQKYNINCWHCNKPFTLADFPIRKTDLITEHHLDLNHMNMKLENRTLVHRSCHKSFHMKDRRAKQTYDHSLAAIEKLMTGSKG